jgi:hypothetical protein
LKENDQREPTFAHPFFVGADIGGEQLVQAIINTMKALLSDEFRMADGPYQGDLSDWIADLAAHRVNPSLFHSQGATASAERELMDLSGSVLVDPNDSSEREIVKKLLDNTTSAEFRRVLKVVASGDQTKMANLKAEILQKNESLFGEVTKEQVFAMMTQLARLRAFRAACLCMVLYKSHPLTIISKAKHGDRRAVLDLIKIDKLFAVDSCVRKTLRSAAIAADKSFLAQFSRSLTLSPRISSLKACRLYLFALWTMNVELPPPAKLHSLLDPDGKKFKTHGAFERFVQRSKAEFRQLADEPPVITTG